MKLTKAERKARRRRIVGGIFRGLAGVAVDAVPGAGSVVKGAAKAALAAVPALKEGGAIKEIASMEVPAGSDFVPLGRTAGKLAEFWDIATRFYGIAMEILDAWEDIKKLIEERKDGVREEAEAQE